MTRRFDILETSRDGIYNAIYKCKRHLANTLRTSVFYLSSFLDMLNHLDNVML